MEIDRLWKELEREALSTLSLCDLPKTKQYII